MDIHKQIYSIIDMFHSLYCRGDKNYRASIATIHSYNLTKVMAKQCAIPTVEDQKEFCDF